MTTVYLKKAPGWFYNSYESSDDSQSTKLVKKGITKQVWSDKKGIYQQIKSIGNLAGPILASWVNPTSFSAYSWIGPGIAALTTAICLIPHEAVFSVRPDISERGKPLKQVAALAGNSMLEATMMMVISTLARDYLYVPRYMSYSALAGSALVFKAGVNLYHLTWPTDLPNVKVKVEAAKETV